MTPAGPPAGVDIVTSVAHHVMASMACLASRRPDRGSWLEVYDRGRRRVLGGHFRCPLDPVAAPAEFMVDLGADRGHRWGRAFVETTRRVP
jgi:hypothetical protein